MEWSSELPVEDIVTCDGDRGVRAQGISVARNSFGAGGRIVEDLVAMKVQEDLVAAM
ncbi:hypothetical protein Ancab_039033 [Ancistrocladus abbreviatus]